MRKDELRKLWLAKRLELSAEEASRLSAQISETLFANLDVGGIKSLHTFLPIAKFREVDTMPMCRRIWQEFPHVNVVVPKLSDETGKMDSCRLFPDTVIELNDWGIPEPVDAETVLPGAIDVVLMPGLCFDVRGHRVGYGKGFYDRFLATVRPDCRKIGLCHFPVLTGHIADVHDGDVPADALITPDQFLEFQPLWI